MMGRSVAWVALATRYYDGSLRGAPPLSDHAVEDELRALGYLK